MQTILTKCRIKPGKEALAHEWMHFLADHLEEGNATLPDEGAHIETWFLSEEPEGLWMYTYTIVDDVEVQQKQFKHSAHTIDDKHKTYMKECVDYNNIVMLKPSVTLGDYSVFDR